MKKVLLLGATGTLGKALADRLVSDTDHEITLFSRHASNQKAVYQYTCPHCGKPFSAYGNSKRKYCSHACDMQRGVLMRRCWRMLAIVCAFFLVMLQAGCGRAADNQNTVQVSDNTASESADAASEERSKESETPEATEQERIDIQPAEDSAKETTMRLYIGETEVFVEWEENASVDALRDLAASGDVTIQMSMYGGFEQVGPLGTDLPRNDAQTTTSAGDIVLYSGNQIVIFYGSNSWSYTRLGRVSDRDATQMGDLLGAGDVTLTISLQ